jgi:hypothetical protein
MISNLERIARRRSRLIADIDREGINMHDTIAVVRQDLAYASLGLMVGKLSSRHVLLRGIILGIVAIAASSRLMKKST